MIKKAKKKIFFVVVAVIVVLCVDFGYKLASNKNASINKVENYINNDVETQRLQKELEEKIEKSKNFIAEQSFDPQIILSETKGSYEVTLDLTNNSNKVTKILTSSVVNYQFDYLATIVYPFDKLERKVSQNGIPEFVFSEHDFLLKPITIEKTKIDDSKESGILRKKQDKNYLVFVTEVAKDNISESSTTQTSYKYASLALKVILINSAKNYGINSIIVNGENLTTKDEEKISSELKSLKKVIEKNDRTSLKQEDLNVY